MSYISPIATNARRRRVHSMPGAEDMEFVVHLLCWQIWATRMILIAVMQSESDALWKERSE